MMNWILIMENDNGDETIAKNQLKFEYKSPQLSLRFLKNPIWMDKESTRILRNPIQVDKESIRIYKNR